MQQCILSFNNRAEVLELPFPLQEWTQGVPHNTYTFSTLDTGDVLAIGNKKLEYITIDSFFPNKQMHYLLNQSFPEPMKCVEMIRRWERSKKPIRIIIVGTDINHAMAIEEFKYGRADKDGSGDIFFSLSLVEYSFLNTPRSQTSNKNNRELKDRPNEATNESKLYTVKKGDTIWDIAEKYLGNGKKWKEIAKLNDIGNGWDLKRGVKIKVPPKDEKQ